MTLSPDQKQLDKAFNFLHETSERNYSWLVQSLLSLLSNQTLLASIRQQAGLQLKNLLQRHSFWSSLDKPSKSSVQNGLLAILGGEQWRPSTAALCIQTLAVGDLPTKEWPDLLHILVGNVIGQTKNDAIISASIETIGYICSAVQHPCIEEHINQILTAIMFCIKLDRGSNSIQAIAINALSDSLEFATVNFARAAERNYIMQVVCEATQSLDSEVSSLALECIIKIVSLYYPLMEEYMSCALCPITLQAVNSGNQKIVFQGIEFWSTLCDVELEMMENCDCDSGLYSSLILPELLDSLHWVLATVAENDHDDWTPSKAAAECLRLLSNCSGNDVLERSLMFIRQNINSEDWKMKYASIMSLASNLEGPDKCLVLPMVQSFFHVAGKLLDDVSFQVRKATSWTISYVVEVLPEILKEPDILQIFMNLNMCCLSKEAAIVEHACTTIATFIPLVFTSDNILDPNSIRYFSVVLDRLVWLTDLNNPVAGSVATVRQVAFQALMELTTHCPQECYHLLEKTILIVLDRLQRLSLCSGETSSGVNITKSFLCATLNSLLLKIEPNNINLISDKVINVLLHLLQVIDVQEDALMAVSTMVELLGSNSSKYIPALFPFLSEAVLNIQDVQVLKCAVGVFGDIYQALGCRMMDYTDSTIASLLTSLANENLDTSVKPEIITTLAEIALALDFNFSKYADTVLKTVLVSKSLNENQTNIRESMIDLYSGIIQGLNGDINGRNVILNYSGEMLNILFLIAMDEDVMDNIIGSSVGLLGDLALNFPQIFSDLASEKMESLNSLLTKGKTSDCDKTKSVSFWASRQLANACDTFGAIEDDVHAVKKARVGEEVYYSMKITVTNKQYITQNIETENVTIRLKPNISGHVESNHVEATVRLPAPVPCNSISRPVDLTFTERSDEEIAELRRLRKKRVAVVHPQEGVGKKPRDAMDGF